LNSELYPPGLLDTCDALVLRRQNEAEDRRVEQQRQQQRKLEQEAAREQQRATHSKNAELERHRQVQEAKEAKRYNHMQLVGHRTWHYCNLIPANALCSAQARGLDPYSELIPCLAANGSVRFGPAVAPSPPNRLAAEQKRKEEDLAAEKRWLKGQVEAGNIKVAKRGGSFVVAATNPNLPKVSKKNCASTSLQWCFIECHDVLPTVMSFHCAAKWPLLPFGL